MTLPGRGDYLEYVMGVYDEAEKVAPLTAQLAAVNATNVTLTATMENLGTVVDDLKAQLADCQASQPDPPPDPDPEPTPVAPALLGLAADDFDSQRAILEATGGQFVATRRFDAGNGLAGLKRSCPPAAAAGLSIVASVKPGQWAAAASGSYDDAMVAQCAYLAGLRDQYHLARVYLAQHHEPGTSPTVSSGESGSAADFGRMYSRFVPIALAHGVTPTYIFNGWQLGDYTEAQLGAWVPADTRRPDVVLGADHYQLKSGGAGPVAAIRKHVAQAGAWGMPYGVGEFNAVDASVLTATGDAIRADTDNLAYACLWSSRNLVFAPIGARTSAGQAIVKNWES